MPSSKHHFPLSQPEKPCFLPLIYLFYFNSNCPLDLHFSIPRTMIYLRSCLVLKTKNHPVACRYMFHNRFPMKKLILNVIVYTMVDSSITLISLNRKLGTDMQNLLQESMQTVPSIPLKSPFLFLPYLYLIFDYSPNSINFPLYYTYNYYIFLFSPSQRSQKPHGLFPRFDRSALSCHVSRCLCFARTNGTTSFHVSKFSSLSLTNKLNSAWGNSKNKTIGYNDNRKQQIGPRIKTRMFLF